MQRTLAALLLCIAALAACAKKEEVAQQQAAPETAPATTPAAPATAATSNEPSLTSFSSGALIVQKPQEYDANWGSFWLLDERHDTGWATPQNVVTPQTIVIEMPERASIERLAFDTGGIDGDGRGAKDVTVEISDTGATGGFRKIADVTLQDKADDQFYPIKMPGLGRWLRVTVQNNHGSPEYIELLGIRAYGKQLTHTPFPNASGTYESDYGNFH